MNDVLRETVQRQQFIKAPSDDKGKAHFHQSARQSVGAEVGRLNFAAQKREGFRRYGNVLQIITERMRKPVEQAMHTDDAGAH